MDNELLQNASNAENPLETLIVLQKKALLSGRIRTALIAVIGALLIGSILYLSHQFSAADGLLKTIDADLQKIDFSKIEDTVEALEKAASNLAKIDMKSINETVKSLNDAANNLSKVDIGALNDLVKSLQTTAGALESVINGWNSLFGR
ncbi:MAG: hypothetical protein IJM50_00040 [Lachnospiraceae bacterium]|nr:hypothetical protein [Lachnospiraceae bacterium]